MRIFFCCTGMFIIQLLYAGQACAGIDEKESAKNLLKAKQYHSAELTYRRLLRSEKNSENYVGLVQSLALQDKFLEAETTVMDARTMPFGNDASLAAVSGLVAYLHANKASPALYPIYLEASVIFCKRALTSDPHNQIALATLKKAELRSKKLETAKSFEQAGSLDLAEREYMDLLKLNDNDLDATFNLLKVLEKKVDRNEEISEPFIDKLFLKYKDAQ